MTRCRFAPGMFALLCLGMVLLSGCLVESLPPGVAAQVNGQPITLRMVEARHDAEGGMTVIAHTPSVELLQQQYSAILAELIAQELVAQELERLGLGVTDEDVDRAMAVIRNDYPDTPFEEALLEAHTDEKTWRALLRYTVALPRFSEQVLRPQVTLTGQEIEKYYIEHAAEFLIPAKYSLLALTSSTREPLVAARERILAGKPWRDTPEVHSQRVDIRPSLLPEVWRSDIPRLAAGKATAVREVNDVWQCMVLERSSPARRMNPVEAYPHIEQALVEQKMENLFATWLESAADAARVKALPQLRYREKEPERKAPSAAQDAEPRNSEPIIDSPEGWGNGTGRPASSDN